ncbi:ras-related protein Rab-38-like [Montipora capricornis]|uniref:ras-related protein Rab-38-like n=1 Tax=Montipora capricornis TaxID=246305 RepID=UPI0035F134A1
MATKYELPEEANEELIKTLGKEVEMKTFKTNAPMELHSNGSREFVKFICVGDYTGGFRAKCMFINDYLQNKPLSKGCIYPPTIGADFALKIIEKWQRSKEHDPIDIKLQLWDIGECERFSQMTRVYFAHSDGALVFWGPDHPSSLGGVPKWLKNIKQVCPSIPCVLITDNTGKEPRQWIGPGKIFESELALDQFCKEHGFVSHFEITSRDWESGEKSVFGQAVNCLLNAVFKM